MHVLQQLPRSQATARKNLMNLLSTYPHFIGISLRKIGSERVDLGNNLGAVRIPSSPKLGHSRAGRNHILHCL